jgi:hypothetical protein
MNCERLMTDIVRATFTIAVIIFTMSTRTPDELTRENRFICPYNHALRDTLILHTSRPLRRSGLGTVSTVGLQAAEVTTLREVQPVRASSTSSPEN